MVDLLVNDNHAELVPLQISQFQVVGMGATRTYTLLYAVNFALSDPCDLICCLAGKRLHLRGSHIKRHDLPHSLFSLDRALVVTPLAPYMPC